MTAVKIHCFEAAGLGKAPFKFVGIQTDADRAVINKERESAGMTFTTNYCTSCDYCSQAIHNAYCLVSADGKRFKVGCDCIRKSGDKGLIKYVTEEESAKRREKTRANNQAKWQYQASLVELFKSGAVDVALSNMPHPKGRTDKSAFDYVLWCVENKFIGSTVYATIADAKAKSIAS